MDTVSDLPIGQETVSSGLIHAKNYQNWLASWVRGEIKGRVLDVGTGLGFHLPAIQDAEEVFSVDLSSNCIRSHQKRWKEGKFHFFVGDFTDPKLRDQLPHKEFDTVFSSNVFEHIEDDQKTFRCAAQYLKPKGKLVLILPAHSFLYGDMDRLAGHYRRYDSKMIRQRAKEAGFQVIRIRYVNRLGGVFWFLNRFVRHKNLSSKSINGQIHIFDRYLVPVWKYLDQVIRVPFGQSVVAVLGKEKDSNSR